MKHLIVFVAAIAALCGCSSFQKTSSAPNTLTRAEQRAGWKLLFDGATGAGWTTPGKQTFPSQGWVIENGSLKKLAGVRGGDLRSANAYSEFDLRWEWKIAPKGNSGLKYFNTIERGGVGHEYQMLDDAAMAEGRDNGKFSTASFYHVLAPFDNKPAALNPAGEWNSSRVFIQRNRVEQWLKDQKVLEYELGSAPVKDAVAKSKFSKVPAFGERVEGYFLLTDHNDAAEFRSVKIFDLSKR